MTRQLPADVAARYRDAGLNPQTVRIAVEHYRGSDGIWRAELPLDDLLIALRLAVGRCGDRRSKGERT
jgi:hypothetical protein